MNKVLYCVFFILYLSIFHSTFAQSANVSAANRVTATHCLVLAKEYMDKQEWNSAISQVELGISYDDSLSDLWYILATAQNKRGIAKARILPLVARALENDEWGDYNRDAARLLYASLLCDTDEYGKAVSVLDDVPVLRSAEADCIRIRSYYCTGTDESVKKARDKIDVARRIYASDIRFAQLFFRYEYAIFLRNVDVPAYVENLADKIVLQMSSFKDMDRETASEIAVYAAAIASNSLKERILYIFNTNNMRHPAYALEALRNGVIGQKEAVEYLFSFDKTGLQIEKMLQLSSLITEEDAKSSLSMLLSSYSGVLTMDTDNDTGANMTAVYNEGKLVSVSWDENNDGIFEWVSHCEDGDVKSVEIQTPEDIEPYHGGQAEYYSLTADYDNYPMASHIAFAAKYATARENFTFTTGDFSWMPFEIKKDDMLNDAGIEFAFPVPARPIPILTRSMLMSSCTFYDIVDQRNSKEEIRFTVLDGVIQSGVYRSGGKMYAYTAFVNGLPDQCVMDCDGDGVFETTKLFGFDTDNAQMLSEKEMQDTLFNIFFSFPSAYMGVYVSKIQVDRNGDSVPDYIEEYFERNGKKCEWDNDNDGIWDIRYVKHPLKKGDVLKEESLFYIEPGHVLVMVTSEDGVPVSVSKGTSDKITSYPVIPGSKDGFYWVGLSGDEQDEETATEYTVAEQGVRNLVKTEKGVVYTIRIGQNIYGKMIPFVEENRDAD